MIEMQTRKQVKRLRVYNGMAFIRMNSIVYASQKWF